MNGITLQALRSLLFFSVPEAARMVAGVQERTWRYWESDRGKVPEDVAETIIGLLVFRADLIAETSAQIEEMTVKHGAPESIRITYYSTLDDWMTQELADSICWRPHCSAMAEIACRHGAVLVRFDAPDYARWLGSRKDNSAMRGEWAARKSD